MVEPERHVLIYDGECGVCRRSMRWVRSADREGRIEPVPYQDPTVRERFPEVARADMERAMQLLSPDGVRAEGSVAAERILDLLPGWRVLRPLFGVPGVRRAARRVYALVARNRRRLGCGEHCGLPPAAAEDGARATGADRGSTVPERRTGRA